MALKFIFFSSKSFGIGYYLRNSLTHIIHMVHLIETKHHRNTLKKTKKLLTEEMVTNKQVYGILRVN